MPSVEQSSLAPAQHPRHHLRAVHAAIARQSPLRRLGKFWHQLGPGLTTGAADDDPSGIATYSQAGSRYGLQLLWLAILTFPFMAVVQEQCARIGLVTGRGLAANIRRFFPRWILFACAFLLFAANTFNIGADLGAMAASTRLLTIHLSPTLWLVLYTTASLLLQIFIPYAQYARILKWLALVLFAYVLTALTVRGVDWGEVLRHAVIPSLSWTKDQIVLICAVFGTTISPYLFFWQTSQEVEEEILEGKRTVAEREHDVSREHLRAMRTDTWFGMFYSNAIAFFIILTGAAVLHSAGLTNIQTAADAASALKPLAGQWASLLFTVGVVGIGLLAIPVLAGSAAYALAESFRWHEGLYRKLKDAYAFYGVIAVSLFVGLTMNFTRLDPIRALVVAAVINGLVAPIILALIVRLASNRRVMGSYANGPWNRVLGWGITGLMVVVAGAALFSLQ